MAEYFTILTTAGRVKLAAFMAGGAAITLTQLAVGDGGGASYDPVEAQTALVGETWRGAIGSIATQDGGGTVVVTATVPATSGGWYVREAAIFDSAGVMIGVAKLPPRLKPAAGSGGADTMTIQLVFAFGVAGAVTVTVATTSINAVTSLTRLPWITVDALQSAPPGAPADGSLYAIGATPTGAWAGKAGQVAERVAGNWQFKNPPEGSIIRVLDGVLYEKDGTTWITFVPPLVGQFRNNSFATTATPVVLNSTHLGCAVALVAAGTLQTVTLPDHAGLPAGAAVAITRTSGLGRINAFGGAAVIDCGAGIVSSILLQVGETAHFWWAGAAWVASGTFMARYAGFTAAQTLGDTGYVRYPGGVIYQWGFANLAPGTNLVSVTLPIAWTDRFIAGSSTDTGGSTYAYSVIRDAANPLTKINVYAPIYWVNLTGSVAARGIATAYWSCWGW